MRENDIQNAFFQTIDSALKGLKTLEFISEKTQDKITDILQKEIKWDRVK